MVGLLYRSFIRGQVSKLLFLRVWFLVRIFDSVRLLESLLPLGIGIVLHSIAKVDDYSFWFDRFLVRRLEVFGLILEFDFYCLELEFLKE